MASKARNGFTSVDFDVAMEIACHEAVVRQAYKDSEGVWTWSVGLTSATGHQVERYIGKKQSMAHCMRIYAWALDNYAHEVRETFKGFALTKAQFAAALSFHWNTGSIRRASWVKHFKAGDMVKAETAFLSWNKPASIKGRRKAEANLLFRSVWSNDGTMAEYTQMRPNGSIVWKSRKTVNVSEELKAALAGEIPAEDKIVVEDKVLPPKVEKEVEKRERRSWGEWLLAVPAVLWAAIAENPWLAAIGVGAVLVIAAVALFGGRSLVKRVREIRAELGAGAVTIALLGLLWPAGEASAHEAPKGWSYPFSCCSGYDCREVNASAIGEKPAGYLIKGTGELLSYADTRIKDSPDGAWHWCSVAGKNDGKTICLFVPPKAF